MREEAFLFDPAYTPLNHGSYGAYPKAVRTRQRELQDLTEARSDPFIRFTIPKLLRESREALAPLLGASSKEVVFTPNATTGINTVLRNLTFSHGDVIIYLNTAYGACEKTILHICETTPAECVRVDVQFPLEDDELVRTFRQAVERQAELQKRVRIAMFDTVATFPGVRLPWESLVDACKEMKVFSLIDGAHGVGHIDLKRLGQINPDFFTSNCYKSVHALDLLPKFRGQWRTKLSQVAICSTGVCSPVCTISKSASDPDNVPHIAWIHTAVTSGRQPTTGIIG
jgi:hercynylcysteine S-oxide lyase